MKAWRNLPLEKRNALVIAVIFLFGICFALFVFRWETPPLVKLWERRHEDQPGLTHDIAFTPDGKYIVTAAQTVKVWRVEDGQQVRSFPINVKDSIGAISPDGRWVATYKIDGTITIWKILEGKIVQTLRKVIHQSLIASRHSLSFLARQEPRPPIFLLRPSSRVPRPVLSRWLQKRSLLKQAN
jgi:WD40 repeat protein